MDRKRDRDQNIEVEDFHCTKSCTKGMDMHRDTKLIVSSESPTNSICSLLLYTFRSLASW